MHKRRNEKRQGLPNRLRACLLASVAVTAVAATPVPAHAFIGGITKAIGGLFGGGGAGGGSGCLGGQGGFFDSILDVGSGLAKAAGGSLGSIGSVGNNLVQGENKVIGCPVMESIPGAMEIQTIKAAVEAVLQTKEMLQQTAHQADMLAHSRFSLIDWLMNNWEEFLSLLGGPESEAITWEQPNVQGEFEEAYPEEPVFTTEEDLKTLRERQAVIGREASIDSKRVSAQLAQDVEELSAQLDSLEMERRNCPGQTCVADVNVQIGMVSAQLSAKVALMQAAHNRVAESQIDAEREAKKAADAEWKRVTEGIDTYSGGN